MCGVAPQQEKKSGKMTLNSPHLTLCGAGGRPAGLMCAHALTHTRPGQSPEASVATWRARIMTSIMSPYSEAEWERVAEEESEREEREHFLFHGCRSPIVARPAGAFSPRLQLIGCPATWGWWLRGRGSGRGGIATVKCPGRAGLRGLFFSFLVGLSVVWAESRSASLPFFSSPPDWSIFQFSCCCDFTAVQYVIFNIIDTCQLSIGKEHWWTQTLLEMKVCELCVFYALEITRERRLPAQGLCTAETHLYMSNYITVSYCWDVILLSLSWYLYLLTRYSFALNHSFRLM